MRPSNKCSTRSGTSRTPNWLYSTHVAIVEVTAWSGREFCLLSGEAFVESLGQSSHSYAMWRVSPLALATLDSALASMQGDHEKNSDAYTFVSGMRESMNAALVGKEDWLRQPDTSSLDQGRVKDSNPGRFKGQLVLVTDSFCASACLDFADAVLAVPGASHFGLSTSGDTLYIDIGSQALPSGAQLWLPLKVWRGRVRGNNQSYDPAIRSMATSMTRQLFRSGCSVAFEQACGFGRFIPGEEGGYLLIR